MFSGRESTLPVVITDGTTFGLDREITVTNTGDTELTTGIFSISSPSFTFGSVVLTSNIGFLGPGDSRVATLTSIQNMSPIVGVGTVTAGWTFDQAQCSASVPIQGSDRYLMTPD